jgi:hydroxymethylbilane synthase
MIQTTSIVERLHQWWPNLEIAIEQISTLGDRIRHAPLSQIGGDGVFVTEIERALRERRVDLAVHSLKDLPTAQPDELRLVIVGPREDVRDAFISNAAWSITERGLQPAFPNTHLATSPRIGTCSLRRTAQLRALCPGAQILPLRGNVDTRLRKLEADDYDGVVLAAAGLHRLNIQERLAGKLTYFPIDLMMPAPGQGALAVEIRDEPAMYSLLAPLCDAQVRAATSAERIFMRRLGAGCYLPVAAYGEILGETLTLTGLVISLDGQQRICVHQRMHWTPETKLEQVEQLGSSLAEQALAQGAAAIILEMNSISMRERQHV